MVGLNLAEKTITEHHSLESQCLLQLIDDTSSLEFLDEADSGVEQEQGTDDTKINPILKTSGEEGSSLSDKTKVSMATFKISNGYPT